MATRSRKALFIQYRNLYSKNTINSESLSVQVNPEGIESNDSERAGLIKKNSPFVMSMDNIGQEIIPLNEITGIPSYWTDLVDEVNESVEYLTKEIQNLSELHRKHLIPNFENKDEEEQLINNKTDEITQTIVSCQRKIQNLGVPDTLDSQSAKLKKNIQVSLATKIQDLSQLFRKAQSSYLSKLRNIEQINNSLITTDSINPQNGIPGFDEEDDDELLYVSSSQLQLLEENSTDQIVSAREKEINEISKSINELLGIFRELQTMVIDQGTILDRIDYNIEQVDTNMENATVQLTKATKYQKRTQKSMAICLVILAGVLILFIIIVLLKVMSRRGDKDNTTKGNS
ncbi:t-SNARE [Anaeromyces robustus]|uniref:t-SNARE n=1 Tax=Anaeromyces robustus TaxID=1754192 RepID=A0A1Y1VVI8_9FUNG|nr:t-SNARE [Anaeromyces robustus]|eukprot:ORX65213.1 t-SNARE [Anaeromyces robustus]